MDGGCEVSPHIFVTELLAEIASGRHIDGAVYAAGKFSYN